MRKCVVGLAWIALGILGSFACSSSDKGTKVEGACAGFCEAFDNGTNCSGAKTQCSNDCDSVASHCPARADAMLTCLAGLSYSCNVPGQANAKGTGATADVWATLTSSAGTLYVEDAYCAQLVHEFNDCAPVGSGGGGGTGGVEYDSGSGGSPSGGSGGTGSGGAGGSGAGGSGGGGQPDLANVDFSFSVSGVNKDPSGEGGPAVPYEVSICINPAQGNYVQVSNNGTGDASAFKMGVQLLKGANVVGGCEDLVESDPLPPGYDTSWINQWCCKLDDVVSSFDYDARTIRVLADVANQVSESNESNNSKMTPEFEVTSQ